MKGSACGDLKRLLVLTHLQVLGHTQQLELCQLLSCMADAQLRAAHLRQSQRHKTKA